MMLAEKDARRNYVTLNSNKKSRIGTPGDPMRTSTRICMFYNNYIIKQNSLCESEAYLEVWVSPLPLKHFLPHPHKIYVVKYAHLNVNMHKNMHVLQQLSGSMQMSMHKCNSHTILQNYPLWCCCHVMYKLLYPSIRVSTAAPVSVRVRVRVSFTV